MTRLVLAMVLALAVPSLAAAQQHHDSVWLKAGIITLGGLGGADIATTAQAAERGNFREVNPVFRPLFNEPTLLGLTNGGLTAGVIYTVVQWHRSDSKAKRIAARILIPGWIVFRGAVVRSNYKLLKADAAR